MGHNCMTCGGSGQDGDAGHSWEFVACRDCDGTGDNLLCLECSEARAVCDDFCVGCWVDFLKANPDEYEPTDSCWTLPQWRDVASQFEASPEWQAHLNQQLAFAEALADYQRSPHQYPTTLDEYRALKGERVYL